MKKVWKWILGIVIVLTLLVAAGFAIHTFGGQFMYARVFNQQANSSYYHSGPMMRDFDSGRVPFNNSERGFVPMMGGRGGFNVRGFSPFFGGFMLLGGLFRLLLPLGLLALVVWFAYQQGKKAGMKSVAPVVAPTPAAPPAPEAETPSQDA